MHDSAVIRANNLSIATKKARNKLNIDFFPFDNYI